MPYGPSVLTTTPDHIGVSAGERIGDPLGVQYTPTAGLGVAM